MSIDAEVEFFEDDLFWRLKDRLNEFGSRRGIKVTDVNISHTSYNSRAKNPHNSFHYIAAVLYRPTLLYKIIKKFRHH